MGWEEDVKIRIFKDVALDWWKVYIPAGWAGDFAIVERFVCFEDARRYVAWNLSGRWPQI